MNHPLAHIRFEPETTSEQPWFTPFEVDWSFVPRVGEEVWYDADGETSGFVAKVIWKSDMVIVRLR